MIGRLHGIVVDCADPGALASFCEELRGMQRAQDEGDRVVIGDAAGRPGSPSSGWGNYRPPTWPTGERPQHRHSDVRVTGLDVASAAAVRLGASLLPGGTATSRVLADPVGHPFCLVTMPEPG